MTVTDTQPALSAEAPDKDAAADPVSDAVLNWGTLLLFIYFGVRLVFFALNISALVPPDEVTHAGLSRIFSHFLLLPEDMPESFPFGLTTNTPWLYYWVMGKLIHLNVFGLPDLVFLRLVNIPLAFVTVSFSLRLLGLMTADRLTRLLLLAVATNTAMFSLLSASVSYDNLANMLAIIAIYYLFAFFRKRSATFLAASLFCQMLGSLAKVSFVPLVLALAVVLTIHAARDAAGFAATLREFFRNSSRRALVWSVLLVLAGALNLKFYGGNYLKYHTLPRSLSQVVSPSAAMQSRPDAQELIFPQFKEGKNSHLDAVMMAGPPPTDNADTLELLMNWQRLQQAPSLRLGPFGYLKFWLETMTATIVGIQGHRAMLKDAGYLVPLYLGMVLAAVGVLLRWRPRGDRAQWMVPALALIPLLYAGLLFWEYSYGYLNYGNPTLTVEGRYLFPVLFPVYVLGCRFLLALFRHSRLRLAVSLAAALIFVCYDFPWFLAHATAQWFSWLPQ